MRKKSTLVATHEGIIQLGDAKIQCAVLEDGRRVLTQSDFMRALGRARQAKGRAYYDGDVELPAFLTAKNLKPFIDDDLKVTSSQITFRRPKGGARLMDIPPTTFSFNLYSSIGSTLLSPVTQPLGLAAEAPQELDRPWSRLT